MKEWTPESEVEAVSGEVASEVEAASRASAPSRGVTRASAPSRQSQFSTYEVKATPNPEDRDLVVEIPGSPRKAKGG